MGKKSQAATVSTYYVGMHLILCTSPVDSVSVVQVDEKTISSSVITGNTDLNINAPELFGGYTREGGITGLLGFRFGGSGQGVDTYLGTLTGAEGTIPAYRDVVALVVQKMYIGLNYYMKPWRAFATRIHKREKGQAQWYDAFAQPFAGNINAVHVLRECLTDTTWGMGISEVLIDTISWEAAAQTCYNEGLGFSFLWYKDSSLAEFIDEVSKHIQAVVYKSRTSGLWVIKLLRYEPPGTISVNLTNTSVVKLKALKRRLLEDLVNQVLVKYEDNATYLPATYRVGNPSLVARQGTILLHTVTYSGVSTPAVAKILGDRDLNQLGLPLYSGTLLCDRSADALNPGDLFSLSYPEIFGETLIYLRVTNINLGTILREAISIDFVEDFFLQTASISTAQDVIVDIWISPASQATPTPVIHQILTEVPYYHTVMLRGDAFAQGITAPETGVMIAAASPSDLSTGAEFWTSTGGSYIQQGNLNFCYYSALLYAINKVDTEITVAGIVDISQLQIGSFAQLGEELIGILAIDTNTRILTIKRGVLDTVPVAHTIGTALYGNEDFFGLDETTYFSGETISGKLKTRTVSGILDLTDAPASTIGLVGRLHLPYPPGNVKFNGEYWLTGRPVCTLVITWASRNRYQQTAGLIDYYTGNITSEPSITYTVEIWDEVLNTLLYTTTTALLTVTISLAALTFDPTTYGKVIVYSESPNGVCFQPIEHLFTQYPIAGYWDDGVTFWDDPLKCWG